MRFQFSQNCGGVVMTCACLYWFSGATASPPTQERVTLIGSASLAGGERDKSGLEGDIAPGFAHARLGAMGSSIDCVDTFAGGAHLIGVNDRGPLDGATAYQCRFQLLTLRVQPGVTPPVGIALDATVLLRRPDGEPFVGLASELGVCDMSSANKVEDGKKDAPAHGTDGAVVSGKTENKFPPAAPLSKRLDPEGIRRLASGNILVSEEYMPGILEFNMQGQFVRAWPVPEKFRCMHPGASEQSEFPPANSSGRQPNKGFEGLAVTPNGMAWAILQGPLIQDGALNQMNKRVGRNIRIVCLGNAGASGASAAGGVACAREVVYQLESASTGVCELLAVDENKFLVLERDGLASKFRRVYEIDVSHATDVSNVATLASDTLADGIVPVKKELLLDLCAPKNGITTMPEKIEGLCFGPTLSDGRRTLIISSDNDLRADQDTWFWVYALETNTVSPPPHS